MTRVKVLLSAGYEAQEAIGFEFDNMMDATDFIETVLAYSMGECIDFRVLKIKEEANK